MDNSDAQFAFSAPGGVEAWSGWPRRPGPGAAPLAIPVVRRAGRTAADLLLLRGRRLHRDAHPRELFTQAVSEGSRTMVSRVPFPTRKCA